MGTVPFIWPCFQGQSTQQPEGNRAGGSGNLTPCIFRGVKEPNPVGAGFSRPMQSLLFSVFCQSLLSESFVSQPGLRGSNPESGLAPP